MTSSRSRWEDAADLLERIVEQDPSNLNGWLDLGRALSALQRYEEAGEAYERALALAPAHPTALLGCGDTRQLLGDSDAALAYYRQALAGAPDEPRLHERLGIALQALGRLVEAVTAFRRCLELDPDRPGLHSLLIFTLDLYEGAEAEAWEERRRWNARFGQPVNGRPIGDANAAEPDRPLRVGYVSADFRHHSSAFVVRPIVAGHDRAAFTVVCYSGVREPDPVTLGFRALADHWRDTARLSDDALEALIRADEIDILVDLSGHSGGNRLPVFARRPAPVQVTAWGYAAGTGLDAIQYLLADPITVPPEAHRHYSEEIVYLPGLLCYEPPDYTPPVVPGPAARRGFVTFGAFNRVEKASAGTRDAWARILTSVPGARLLVKTTSPANDPSCRQLVDDLAARGIDRTRMEVRGNDPHLAHMADHGAIDILLDPFPHGGGVTTMEALTMGVPVVTLLGDRVSGRVSAACLEALGLGDLIARTADEYVAIATRLAGAPARLAAERTTLRERMLASPIGDTRAYTRAVEVTYRELWGRWCRQQPVRQPTRRTVAGRPARPVRRDFGAREG